MRLPVLRLSAVAGAEGTLELRLRSCLWFPGCSGLWWAETVYTRASLQKAVTTRNR